MIFFKKTVALSRSISIRINALVIIVSGYHYRVMAIIFGLYHLTKPNLNLNAGLNNALSVSYFWSPLVRTICTLVSATLELWEPWGHRCSLFWIKISHSLFTQGMLQCFRPFKIGRISLLPTMMKKSLKSQ